MTSKAEDARPFIQLGAYDRPALPAEESARRWLERLRNRLRPADEAPLMPGENLERAGADRLDRIAPHPPTGPLREDLELTLADWARGPGPSACVVVLPPGDPDDTLAAWAGRNGAVVPEPPERARLLDSRRLELPDLSAPLIVIPRLEEWFLRHSDGMDLLERLLAAIDEAPGLVLVGCNSWAWRFLASVFGADALLPPALTFQPFDAPRLAAWFMHLARDEGEADDQIVFRRVDTGSDVFADEAEAHRKNDYFRKLAARSLGIPWVAWHIWRQGLRTGRDLAESEERAENGGDGPEGDGSGARPPAVEALRAEDETTVWVATLDDGTLPSRGGQETLLVLHALMLHGPLTAEMLRHTLPVVGRSVAVPALLRAGLATRDAQDRIAVRPEAYPTVHDGLRNAGFPVGEM